MACPLGLISQVCELVHSKDTCEHYGTLTRDDCLRAAHGVKITQIGNILVEPPPAGPRRVVEDGFVITINEDP